MCHLPTRWKRARKQTSSHVPGCLVIAQPRSVLLPSASAIIGMMALCMSIRWLTARRSMSARAGWLRIVMPVSASQRGAHPAIGRRQTAAELTMPDQIDPGLLKGAQRERDQDGQELSVRPVAMSRAHARRVHDLITATATSVPQSVASAHAAQLLTALSAWLVIAIPRAGVARHAMALSRGISIGIVPRTLCSRPSQWLHSLICRGFQNAWLSSAYARAARRMSG